MKNKKGLKGIILAGGKATRLYPITKGLSKQLLPVYNKPMIYYPLSALMLAGVTEVLIITTPESLSQYQLLLQDGSHIGISIQYATQDQPRGLAEAFLIGESFIGQDSVVLALGDNIFFGYKFSDLLIEAIQMKKGATILGYYTKEPERYGVIEFDKNFKAISIEEKPKKPKSHWAITGLYFFDQQVVDFAKKVNPSSRGELEITDILDMYRKKNELNVKLLGRGHAWLDTGTYDSLIDAAIFIRTIEERQGLQVGCIEEVAYRKGFISREQLAVLARGLKTSYGDYLKDIVKEKT